jgi:hypothetical protein
VQVSHTPDRLDIVFDDGNLVAHAGLALTSQLAARLGVRKLVRERLHLDPGIPGSANAALIKVNQIGTVSETLEAMRLCRDAGWAQFVSHRSGETEDTFVADLATGTGCGQLKSGAPARGERVAKYNRLMEIETYDHLPYGIR